MFIILSATDIKPSVASFQLFGGRSAPKLGGTSHKLAADLSKVAGIDVEALLKSLSEQHERRRRTPTEMEKERRRNRREAMRKEPLYRTLCLVEPETGNLVEQDEDEGEALMLCSEIDRSLPFHL